VARKLHDGLLENDRSGIVAVVRTSVEVRVYRVVVISRVVPKEEIGILFEIRSDLTVKVPKPFVALQAGVLRSGTIVITTNSPGAAIMAL
jgi:hypothetical protein